MLQTKVENPGFNHSSDRKPRTQLTSRREMARAHISYQPPSRQPTWHFNCFCSRSWGSAQPGSILLSASLRVDRLWRELRCRQQFSVTTLPPTLMAWPIAHLRSMNYKFKRILITHVCCVCTHTLMVTDSVSLNVHSFSLTHSSWDLICYAVMVLMGDAADPSMLLFIDARGELKGQGSQSQDL